MAASNILRELFVRIGLVGDKKSKQDLKKLRKELKDAEKNVTDLKEKMNDRGLFARFRKGIKGLIGDTAVFKANLAALAVSGFFNKIGQGIGFLTGQFKDLLTTSSELASVQKSAELNLENILRIGGEFTPTAFQGLKDFASSLQEISTVGDEVILKGLGLAKTFKATNDQAKLIVEAAVNFSTATGKTFEEAIRQISKTLGGYAGELGEVNVEIKDLTSEQLKAGKAAEILNKQFGGIAAKNVDSFGGQLKQLFNVIGDLKEEIGIPINEVLLPAIRDAKEALKNAFPLFRRFGENIAKTAGVLLRLFKTFGGRQLFEDAVDGFGQFIIDIALLFEDLVRFISGKESFIGNQLKQVGGFKGFFKNLITDIADATADFVLLVAQKIGSKLLDFGAELGKKFMNMFTFGNMDGGGAPNIFDLDSVKRTLSGFTNLFSGFGSGFSGGSGILGASASDFTQAAAAGAMTTNTTNNNFNQNNSISTSQAGGSAINELLQTWNAFRMSAGIF